MTDKAMRNAYTSAFPAHVDASAGMNLREYIATAALQGLLAKGVVFLCISDAAKDAVIAADALLEELAKPPGEKHGT